VKRSKKGKKPTKTRRQARTDRARQPGLPAEDSVREEVELISPKKHVYRILKTTERDTYDR
jgi:hypothetical protein